MDFKVITGENINIAAQIFKNSFNAAPWFEKWSDETAFKRLSQIMRCDGAIGLIAYDDSMPAAMIVGHSEDYYDGTRFLIKEFCVVHGTNGKGLGTKVLAHYMGILKEKGIVQTSLYTLREKKVVRFYEKAGFKEIEDLVMMEI